MSEDKLKEIEDRRAARKAEAKKARTEQYAKDLEALDALEQEHGDESVAALEVSGFVKGLPSIVVVKTPGGTPLYKRYTDMVRKAGKNNDALGKAAEMLGESCLVYPSDEETRKAMFEAFPGMKLSAYQRAIKFAELEAADEKKD